MKPTAKDMGLTPKELRQIRREVREKLAQGAKLKPGDKVQDCRYKVCTIKSIEPSKPNGEIVDYDLVFTDRCSCSWMHCCDSYPLDDESIEIFFLREAMEHPDLVTQVFKKNKQGKLVRIGEAYKTFNTAFMLLTREQEDDVLKALNIFTRSGRESTQRHISRLEKKYPEKFKS